MFSARSLSPLLLLGALSAFAQSPTGTISGVVTDASGAVLKDADVTVTEVSTNVSHALKTDEQGRYTLPFTLPGTYKVSVTVPNFQPQVELASMSRLPKPPSLTFTSPWGRRTRLLK